MKPDYIGIERRKRAGECLDALNKCVEMRDGKVAREIYEAKTAEFKKDFGADYRVFLNKNRQRTKG